VGFDCSGFEHVGSATTVLAATDISIIVITTKESRKRVDTDTRDVLMGGKTITEQALFVIK
jgi:hypothetical protein